MKKLLQDKQEEWIWKIDSWIDFHEVKLDKECREALILLIKDDLLAKVNCPYCKHKETDYHCPCFHEGFETSDAEQCFEKLADCKEKADKECSKKIAQAFNEGYRSRDKELPKSYQKGIDDCKEKVREMIEKNLIQDKYNKGVIYANKSFILSELEKI